MSVFEITKDWAEKKNLTVLAHQTMTSTQVLAKEQAFDLVLCDHQTFGKGRSDRIWLNTKPGSQLLSTWRFFVQNPVPLSFSAQVGLCLFQSLQQTFFEIQFSLKPPNDIYIEDKKLAGLLIDNVIATECQSYIGLGINVLAIPDLGLDQSKDLQATCLLQAFQERGVFQSGEQAEILKRWPGFLDFWHSKISNQIALPQLKDSQIKDLYSAIKSHPDFRDLLRVDADAKLYFPSKILTWVDLL